MNNLTRFSVICTSEAALKKLKKADIPVWFCRKEGARFLFSVKDKDIKKVFAIFIKPCYNVKAVRQSPVRNLLKLLSLRIGLVAGAAVFVAAAVTANAMVLKIEVEGSGKYLENEVRSIVYEAGARKYSTLGSFDKALATGRILALPQVTFCNIEKRGSVLVIDVRTDAEQIGTVSYESLVSDAEGTVINIVAVCGTALYSAGDVVSAGDVLIAPYVVAGEERVECLAVGYAVLQVSARSEYTADCESDENLRNAYSSLLLEDGDIISRSYTVEARESGVVYIIDFDYLHKLSINLS